MTSKTLWIWLIAFIAVQQTTFAQMPMPQGAKNGTIKGSIIDAQTKKALEFATISVYTPSDSLISGAITDALGDFTLNKVPFGNYYAKLTFMGYVTRRIDSIEISAEKPFKMLGKLALQADAQTQDEVEIVGEKSLLELGLDKKVFNVEKSDLANAENATEVLRGTPTVEVDKDEKVKVRGKVVQVFINGKPTGLTGENQAAVLRQIPANTIKKIEIITNPSAKHAPDGGSSGIINIVMKRNPLQGFTGSVRLGTGTNARAWQKNGTGPLFNKYNGGLSLNYKTEKLNLFSNISAYQRNSFSISESFNQNFLPDSSYYFHTVGDNQNSWQSLWGRMGMDYYFNDMHSLSFQLRSSPNRNNSSGYTYFENFDIDSIQTGEDRRYNDNQSMGQNWTYNVVYSILFPEKDSAGNPILNNVGAMGENRELTFDLQYSTENDRNENLFSEYHYGQTGELSTIYPDSQRTLDLDKNQEIWAKVDYTHPFKDKKRRLEVGYHFRWRMDQSDFNFYDFDFNQNSLVNDSSRSNLFEYTQQIHALYGTYNHKFSDKWSAKFGLRIEQAFVNSVLKNTNESFPWRYFQPFPSLHVSYQMNMKQQMTFSYSRRIQRPGIWSVNPFPSFSNPRFLWYGNPYLQPSFTNSIEVNYGHYLGMNSINMGLFANYANNESTSIQVIDSITGVISSTPQNLAFNYQVGLELSTNLRFTKWLSMNLNGNFYRSHYDASAVDENLNYNTFGGYGNMYLNARFDKIGMSISMGGSSWFQFRDIQGRSIPQVWHWASVSQQLLKKKLRLSVWLQNPFFNNIYRSYRETPNFVGRTVSQWENRVFNISASYNFGKVNVKNKRRSKLQGRTDGGGSGGGGGQGGGR
jgi:iron complex outermembrane receptor protein